MLPETVQVNGIEFVHHCWTSQASRRVEFYQHVDQQERVWSLYKPSSETNWLATCYGGNIGEQQLNAARVSDNIIEAKGPLYHLDSSNPLTLLAAMAQLIKDANMVEAQA